MERRMQLHQILLSICANVYFQPPESLTMAYPCIRYNREKITTKHADDMTYSHKTRYRLTVIDTDPDSQIPNKIIELPLCTYDRSFVADELNHDVFLLYF